MNRKNSWKPVIEKINNKLFGWKSKTLSFGGRLTLAISVLGSLPFFYLSIFAAPVGVIETMERIRRNFIWEGSNNTSKIRWVAWEKILSPKEVGGLGLGSIKSLNLALLSKWRWKFLKERCALWARIIKGIHKIDIQLPSRMSSRYICGVWKNIDNCKTALEKLNIAGSEVIRRDQEGTGWESDFEMDGQFSIAALRRRIDRANHLIPDGVFQWNNWIPIKVSCFIWRARWDRIPTALALSRWGVQVQSVQCSACVFGMESADHLLLECPFVAKIWNQIWEWCRVKPQRCSRVKELLTNMTIFGECLKRKKTLHSIISGALWGIWRGRNERVLNTRFASPELVFEGIRSVVHVWIKHHYGKGNFIWGGMAKNSFLFM
ncbi:uncharacterized protein LOC111915667 [Lactuca sativa]|uniref:uncharacterized protein LOC111915667 n=1 Tax=Lactuca sativa TaxID=4236 RepID=UPI000CD9D458|nr:uncharacterized protein LOC111915667 [Lactuca sativa]